MCASITYECNNRKRKWHDVKFFEFPIYDVNCLKQWIISCDKYIIYFIRSTYVSKMKFK